ncbi:MAG: hypothetical protein L0Y73_03915, partial [Candidatus Aminicenantes bacterium]|nr:hypothetical protein [Candidatus Aminicenantes bacterium]
TRRGNLERVEKTFKKEEKLILRGYEFSIYIGKPAFVKFFLNEKEVTYLNELKRPERIDINPRTLQRIVNK